MLPHAPNFLAPVRTGLQLVEVKMKGVESALFAPLANAFVDLINSGGKRVRPAIALMAAEFNGPIRSTERYDQVVSLAAAVEMLHTASLVHDDVIDGAMLRRGAPTLNANWPQGSTVLAGNYMFGQAASFAAQTGNMRVIHIFSDTLEIIVNGELHQMHARHDYQQERSTYYQRIYAKTASLFTAATESAAVLSGLAENRVQDLKAYGYNLGMAFQIVDDILDFTGDEQSLGKPAGSDLGQGTLTLPFFYFMQQTPEPGRHHRPAGRSTLAGRRRQPRRPGPGHPRGGPRSAAHRCHRPGQPRGPGLRGKSPAQPGSPAGEHLQRVHDGVVRFCGAAEELVDLLIC